MTAHQRQFTRHQVVLQVEVRTRTGWSPCTTVDVSRGGLFMKSEARFELQRVVQLRLHLPDGEAVSILSQVRRNVMQVPGASPVPGIGVEFFDMAAAVQARWDRFVLSISEADKQAMADALHPDDAVAATPGAGHATHTAGRSTLGATPAAPRHDTRAARATAAPRPAERPARRRANPPVPHRPRDDLASVVIRIRPSGGGRLQRLVEQRLAGEPADAANQRDRRARSADRARVCSPQHRR